MSPALTQALDRRVMEVMEKEQQPRSPSEVVSAVQGETNESETAILEAIWRLLHRMQLELTPNRQLQKHNGGGVPGGALHEGSPKPRRQAVTKRKARG